MGSMESIVQTETRFEGTKVLNSDLDSNLAPQKTNKRAGRQKGQTKEKILAERQESLAFC